MKETKHLSLILNAVLIIAVAILYYLHFSENKPSKSSSKKHVATTPTKAASIVYVNSDSLLEKYDYLTVKKKELERKQQNFENDLQKKAEQLQKKAEDYQRTGASMSPQQQQATEQRLMQEQQELMAHKENLSKQFYEESQKIDQELLDKISSFLKEYNEKHQYQYILGFQKGGGILLADDSLNITKDVIDGLNERLKKEKK